MPRHSDFEKIFRQFQTRYGSEKGEDVYHAWLKKLGLDDTKPYRNPQEAFKWAEPLFKLAREDETAKYFRVDAAYPVTSMNGNIYTEDELLRATRTLVGKQVNLNHQPPPLEDVEIVGAEYEDGSAECVLRIPKDSEIFRRIASGEIVHVSVEATSTLGVEPIADGNVIGGLVFTGLALLTKDVLPGIPLTRLEPVEKIVESFNLDGHERTPRGDGLAAELEVMRSEMAALEGRILTKMAHGIGGLESRLAVLERPSPKAPDKPDLIKRTKDLQAQGMSGRDAWRLATLELLDEVKRSKSPR